MIGGSPRLTKNGATPGHGHARHGRSWIGAMSARGLEALACQGAPEGNAEALRSREKWR